MNECVRAVAALSCATILGALGIAGQGCGGGGGGGGGGIAPTASAALPGLEPYVQLDVRTGQAAPAFGMPQDGKPVPFGFPGVTGKTYTLDFDTQPSGRRVRFTLGFVSATGTTTVPDAIVTTPLQRIVTPSADATVLALLFDEDKGGLVVNRASAIASGQQPNTSSITAVVHFCGDSFAGFGSFNDLATQADKQAFAGDLLNGINAFLAQGGVQITTPVAFRTITTAAVQASQPQLVSGGSTIIDGNNPAASASSWGTLGMPETDAQFGLSLDIFVVRRTIGSSDAVGQAAVASGIQAGIFRGTGSSHGVVLSLFTPAGTARPMATIRYVAAHEIGHFLGLRHTMDPSLTFDPILDTPRLATKASYDPNGSGVFEPSELSASHPDFSNLMYPYLPVGGTSTGTVTAEQGLAMRAYLAVREH